MFQRLTDFVYRFWPGRGGLDRLGVVFKGHGARCRVPFFGVDDTRPGSNRVG